MKFVMERKALLEALALAVRIAPRRSPIPILGHVLIAAGKGKVLFTATDMDRTLAVGAYAATIATGTTTANVHNLAAFVRTTADGCQVEAEVAGERLVLRAGRAKASLPILDPKDFPELAPDSATAAFKVKGTALAIALKRVAHAVSNEETRYYLNGVFLERRDDGMRLTATDGHRLATVRLPIEGALPAAMPNVIVPRQATGDLQAFAADAESLLDFEVSASRLAVRFDGVTFGTKLVDGTFPDYERVIPRDSETGLRATRADLMGALARCASIDSDVKNNAVKIALEGKAVQLSRHSADDGDVDDELDVEPRGKSPTFTGVNSRYLLDALNAFAGAKVDLDFEPNAPMVLRDPDDRDSQLHLVMAMRVA